MACKKVLIASLLLLLLVTLAEASRKAGRRGISASRRDNDGFSFFKSKGRDSDGFFKKIDRDDDAFRSHSKGVRRSNAYASRKMEEFGDRFGKSMGAMLWNFLGSEEEVKMVSGKRVKSASTNDQRPFNHDSALSRDWVSIGIIAVCVILCLEGIYLLITRRPFADDEAEKLVKKAKKKHEEKYKNFHILQYIRENGVHPDRAAGKIY
jgi:hypothetical protein